MTGAELIAAERERQVKEKGWTPENDDCHTRGELAECASMIVNEVLMGDDDPGGLRPAISHWPAIRADHVRGKYAADHVRRLTIAGALIAAEIDRLNRAASKG